MDVLLYVADDFKVMENQKLLAIGLYPDRVVVLNATSVKSTPPSPDSPSVLEALSFMLCVRGIEPGRRAYSLEVIGPSGKATGAIAPPQTGVVPPNAPLNLAFRFAPYIVTALGKHVVRLTVDGVVLDSDFEVRWSDQLQ